MTYTCHMEQLGSYAGQQRWLNRTPTVSLRRTIGGGVALAALLLTMTGSIASGSPLPPRQQHRSLSSAETLRSHDIPVYCTYSHIGSGGTLYGTVSTGGTLTGVVPGEDIDIFCDGVFFGDELVTAIQASPLARTSAVPSNEADQASVQSYLTDFAGSFIGIFPVPNPFSASDPNAVCPATAAQTASVGDCFIEISDGTYGSSVNLQYATPPPPTSHGYWLVGSDGGIFSFGSAQFHGSMGGIALQRPVVGIVPTSDRGGYWLDASDGGVFSFGDTQFYGSIPGLGLNPAGSGKAHSLNAPIVGMVPSHDQGGYFMVASDGGVFAFGDAHFAGSCPGIGGCSGAAVAVMPDASGNGYWLVTASGHVYTFGDAPYLGQPGSQSSPITSAVATPDGGGYDILDANGQVFAYGDANGSLGNVTSGAVGGFNPASAIFVTSDNGGYWVSDALGDVFTFGDAPNDGSMAGTHLNGSIIAASGS
jgi:hypothetical protein